MLAPQKRKRVSDIDIGDDLPLPRRLFQSIGCEPRAIIRPRAQAKPSSTIETVTSSFPNDSLYALADALVIPTPTDVSNTTSHGEQEHQKGIVSKPQSQPNPTPPDPTQLNTISPSNENSDVNQRMLKLQYDIESLAAEFALKNSSIKLSGAVDHQAKYIRLLEERVASLRDEADRIGAQLTQI